MITIIKKFFISRDNAVKFGSIFCFILHLLILLVSRSTYAQQAPSAPLVFAGFAFSGDYDKRTFLYPHSASLIEQSPNFVDDLILLKLRARPTLLNRLSLDKADLKRDITSIACALVQENVEIQRIDGKYLVIVLMQANVLAFNRMSNSVVASYPLRMRFSRTRNSEPNREDLLEIVREAFTSNNPSENLLDQWLIKLENTKFRSGAKKYLRVNQIDVSPEAETVIQQAGMNLSAFKNRTANLLEAALADKSGIPIVPNTVGEVIGNKMALRFSSAEAFSITLPEPDYAVSFLIRGFASKTTENAVAFTDIYRAKATFTIKLPDTGKIYIDEQLYDTKFVTRPKSTELQFSAWDQYNKTLQSLINLLGMQLVNPDDDWLKEHAARTTEAKPAFLKVKQLFQEL